MKGNHKRTRKHNQEQKFALQCVRFVHEVPKGGGHYASLVVVKAHINVMSTLMKYKPFDLTYLLQKLITFANRVDDHYLIVWDGLL